MAVVQVVGGLLRLSFGRPEPAGCAEGIPGLVNDENSARPLRRDPHEHRVRVGVGAEVTQENAAGAFISGVVPWALDCAR